MELCLVRHGVAEERGPRWPNDDLRPLTAQGKERMRAAAAGLARLWKPEVILTSPLVRARQTAGIVAEAMGGVPLVESETLANGDDDGLLEAVIRTGKGAVMAVGHEPTISGTLAWLLTGDDMGFATEFKKGAAALVLFAGDAAGGKGMLGWYMPPSALRAMAGSGR